ncbi:MAG: HNH endonuclease signature motif containing protein [Methylobacter sp.]
MKRRFYTEEMLAFLQENRKKMTGTALTSAFNQRFKTDKKTASIASVCNKSGWHSAISGRFSKGFKPHNYGTQGISKPNSGSFKSGQTSPTKCPVGSERINGTNGYIMIKTADPDKWRQKHYVVWESFNGPVPKGFIIRFNDGVKTNCDTANLELTRRQEHLRINNLGYTTAPDELKPVIKALAKVESRIFERLKQSEQQSTL